MTELNGTDDLDYSKFIVRPAPLSTSKECQEKRNKIDFTIKITKEMALSGKVLRPVRVYADGVYDVFHSGHAEMLLQAKTCFPNVYLIAGVHSDEETHKRKGVTVNKEAERIDVVRHCRYVDEVFTQAPWLTLPDWMEENKIDFIAHDDAPYGGQGENDIYADLKANGRFIATKRREGVSTTDLISRVIKEYDMYVDRNSTRGDNVQKVNGPNSQAACEKGATVEDTL